MLALLPWYVMAEIRTPGFLQYFIVGEHFLRFVDPAGKAICTAPRTSGPMAASGWTGCWRPCPGDWRACGCSCGPARTHRCGPGWRRWPAIRCAPTCCLWGWPRPFFTLSGNILWTYVLPSLPPLARLGA